MLKRHINNKGYKLLETGTPIEKIKDELRQGVHRPERINTHNLNIFDGSGFLRYFYGDPNEKYYNPKVYKNPYLMDEDMLFYKGIDKKGYYLTLRKEKEKIMDVGDEEEVNEWGAENIYYIPLLKSFNNLDKLDEMYIKYIVILKHGGFPDRFGKGEKFVNDADIFLDKLRDNKNKLGSKLTDKYPILLKPEYNLDAINASIQFHFDYYDYSIARVVVDGIEPPIRNNKSKVYDLPTT